MPRLAANRKMATMARQCKPDLRGGGMPEQGHPLLRRHCYDAIATDHDGFAAKPLMIERQQPTFDDAVAQRLFALYRRRLKP
ncbi:MAG: hypothetical protein ACLP1D_25205 [Xanthobacteraceae bacterium]